MENYNSTKCTLDQNIELYWQENKRVLYRLLKIWAVVMIISGLALTQGLEFVRLFDYPLGLRLKHEGSMLLSLGFVFIYQVRMKKIKQKYGFSTDNPVKLTKQILANKELSKHA